MNAEQSEDVARRARLHGALADPTRLQVVDALTIGDAASSELSGKLGTPSNLLAHHLGILESTGVIERHRSEGDGRRSYWRLVPGAFARLSSPGLAAPPRVVFVCTANSARSHLAAALWRSASAIPVTSAGTQPSDRIHPGAAAAARRRRLDLLEARPQHVRDVIGEDDLIITVCDRAHEELGPSTQIHWSIPDPVAVGSRAAFDRACDDLANRVHRLAPLLDQTS